MFDLGRKIKRQMGKLRMHRAKDAQRMSRPIQEVWVAERDMGRAGLDLLPNVPDHHIFRNQEEAAPVDRHDRAMQAGMQAASAGFHVPHDVLRAVILKMGIPCERVETLTAWLGALAGNRLRDGLRMRQRRLTPSIAG